MYCFVVIGEWNIVENKFYENYSRIDCIFQISLQEWGIWFLKLVRVISVKIGCFQQGKRSNWGICDRSIEEWRINWNIIGVLRNAVGEMT